MNKATRKYYNSVAELGCIVCRMDGFEDTPCQLHHLREGAGMSQRSVEVIPLCKYHHDAFHLDRVKFTRRYGSEEDLLDRVKELL